MAAERWSSDNNIAFMKLYREQENLWNCFDKNYRNRDMRKASLEHIATEMHLGSTSEVTKKIKNLRSTYNQEVNKIEKSKKSGAGADDVYKPSIKWFDVMDYIMKTINLKEKETTSNLKDNTPDLENAVSQDMEENTDENTDDKTGDKTLDKSEDTSINSSDNKQTTKKKNPGKAKKSQNTAQEMSGIKAAINELKQLNSNIESSSSSQQQEDEYDVVGKHVAIQLRQLPLLDFIDAKDEIQRVLSRYRKRAIYARNASSLSSYSASSPQPYIPSPSPGPSVPFPGISVQPVQPEQSSSASYNVSDFNDPIVRAMQSVQQPLQSVSQQSSHASYEAVETVSAQQPVQPEQSSCASYSIIDFNDPIVRAMLNANVTKMQ